LPGKNSGKSLKLRRPPGMLKISRIEIDKLLYDGGG
jgi:hypothetical protein